MDSPRPAVDLEKELTCSICTELLYQPLTLLDCLHTFDGACLKEWFSWQATAAEHAPNPPSPGSAVFTCPSCRAQVRDTRHNATVATLLDMFLAANPDKAKPDEDKAEMNKKFKPGDKVLRKLNIPEKTPAERRLDEEERRLIEEVRQMSIREAVAGASSSSSHPPRSRRRGESHSRDGRSARSRDPSVEPNREGRARDARERARRHAAEDETRRRSEQAAGLRPEASRSGDEGHRRRSGSRHRSAAAAGESPERRQRRHIEHQSSLRSLISSGDMDPREIEREIEDFARQIQEEGLLEGLDLDNIDLSNNDELSRKITEAYRRRQRQRTRHETARRSNASNASGNSHHSDPVSPDTGSTHLGVSSSRATSRQGTRSRTSSQTGQTEDRSRAPISSGTTHLEVQEPRRRRRTTSGGRSATVPVVPPQAEVRVAARSQTDLSLRTNTSDVLPGRPVITNEGRSTSTPTMTATTSPTQTLPFRARAAAAAAAAASTGLGILQPQQPSTTTTNVIIPSTRSARPTPLTVSATTSSPGPSFSATADPVSISPGLSTPPLLSPTSHKRTRSQLYPEPSITCKRCLRQHIEYTLHYNCQTCHGGHFDICLDCYRRGKGCLHWFGFGYGAFAKWDMVRRGGALPLGGGAVLAPPHVLTANRYRKPKIIPGGAEGRQTLTNQNPAERLESGTFCARCAAWTTKKCYWRCDVCNEGDWGFCTDCVGTGRCCSHLLLPLAYFPASPRVGGSGESSPVGGGSPGGGGGGGGGWSGGGRAATAAVQTDREAGVVGPFRPVVFTTRCEVCRVAIGPGEERLHCYACPSSFGSEARAGEYEVCEGCYAGLESEGRISAENGAKGWRRCLSGHRMAVVSFVEGRDGVWRRSVVRDWVGGRKLGFEEYDTPGMRVCYWFGDGQRLERLVTRDVAAAADVEVGVPTRWTEGFPPDGGSGDRAVARWAWYPAEGADDELIVPKGAEVREIEDVNGEWSHGVYMGSKGLFPAPYVVPIVDT